MFAIAFDLVVSLAKEHHPKSAQQAYVDIGRTLAELDFEWVQGSVYVCESEDLANLFSAISALKAMPWFPLCVRDIRAFRVEQWSDFTDFIKGDLA